MTEEQKKEVQDSYVQWLNSWPHKGYEPLEICEAAKEILDMQISIARNLEILSDIFKNAKP